MQAQEICKNTSLDDTSQKQGKPELKTKHFRNKYIKINDYISTDPFLA